MAAPKLRFKEFDGDWSSVSLLEISTLITKGTTPKQFIEGNINFLKIEAITQNGFDLSKCQTISDEINNKELKRSVLMEGDILFAIAGATIGKNAIVQKELLPANTNQALAIIRLKENYSKIFISKVLNSPLMEKYIDINISTGAQPNLNLQQIGSFSFALPKLEEQTKIASFLSNVDEKINQLTQKHALLSQYKQGMMQKLFSQQIRFKADDGSEFGEWEETVLEKIGAFLKGKGISKADIVEDGFTPCIRYGELYTHYGEVISKVISATNLEIENLILSKANDVLIPASGETQIDIATASCVLHDDVALSGDLNIFRTKENGVFLSYLIRSHLKMQIAQLAQGNSVVHLYSSQLKGVRLNLPCLEEQTKIANFLSAIDQKIEVVAQQIEQAKQWKKGLLQQMFV